MIKRKKKVCKGCSMDEFLFGEGLCKKCYSLAHPVTLKRTPIKQKSKNKKDEDKEYKKLRDEYIKEYPICEAYLEGCTIKSTEVHHKAGRGSNYLNKDKFLAICHNCHVYITEHSKQAIEQGLSESRLKRE